MTDPIFDLIQQEQNRQDTTLQLIPSENFCSPAVRRAVGSVLMNKYSEGYPGKRYYEGNEFADQVEQLAIDRAKQLFDVPYVNVQPYSGSPANSAIQMALLEPGDTLMGLELKSGGHLTHGHPKITFSGKFFRSVQFGVRADAHIDLDAVRALAKKEQPKLIIIGTTAYPFQLDFAGFAQIANEVGAWLAADISHITGLIVGGAHPSPFPHVDVVMTTTHKTLRGPRGAMILATKKGLSRDPELGSKLDRAVFPGLQGGPHDNTTAGIAVALAEASTPEFRLYAQRVVENAHVLATELQKAGIQLVGNGTENHLMILDLGTWGGGTQTAFAMAQAGLVANKNTIPQEPLSPFFPSGVRLGTPAITTRGLQPEHMRQLAQWIAEIVTLTSAFPLLPSQSKEEKRDQLQKAFAWARADARLAQIRSEVATLCTQFPLVSE